MHFDERDEGDYRIHAGALESPTGDGYLRAVVVTRWWGCATSLVEVFRDDGLAEGDCWRRLGD